MENSKEIVETIEKIEVCEELINDKQSILKENEKNIRINTKETFEKLESVEAATEQLVNRARAYAALITGMLALPLTSSQILDYGLSLDNKAIIDLTFKLVVLLFTYRISYLTADNINLRIKAKEIFGSYKKYLETKRKAPLYDSEVINIMDNLDSIKDEKEKLQGYKQVLTDYLDNNGYINEKELTTYISKANNKVTKLTKKLSTIQSNSNEFIDFK